MVWLGREPDPTTDRAALDVVAAYESAERAGLPLVDCYRAGVEAWRRAHSGSDRDVLGGEGGRGDPRCQGQPADRGRVAYGSASWSS
jgi:hypothetical protein